MSALVATNLREKSDHLLEFLSVLHKTDRKIHDCQGKDGDERRIYEAILATYGWR